ncbi:Zinc metalloproteinase nas-39 [Holothuria leucospilota]|uniref:Zinc metalloproteinase nas-39 n=1 Tax=Holothuria leucospilota TaxID=206669 RepID=A0A9Q1CDN5_HOLLE|nr:Zinc metalloproteinase nas-39 [Holothuria leucospilota]
MFLKHNFLVLITTVVLTTRGLVKGQACIYTISDTNGFLDYPVGDGNYTNNVNCTWKFIAPFGRSVEVTFTSIDLQPMFLDLFCVDSVTVYDGVPGSTLFTFPFCGGGPSWPRKPYRFVSSSNILSITMSTDQSLTGTGFVAEYKHGKIKLSHGALGVSILSSLIR